MQGQDCHPSAPAAPLSVHGTAPAIAGLGMQCEETVHGFFFVVNGFLVFFKKPCHAVSLCLRPSLSSSQPLHLSPVMPPGAQRAEPGSPPVDLEVIFLTKWGRCNQ